MKIDGEVEMIHKNGNVLQQAVTLPLKEKPFYTKKDLIINTNSVIVGKTLSDEEEDDRHSTSNANAANSEDATAEDYANHHSGGDGDENDDDEDEEDDNHSSVSAKYYDDDFRCPICKEAFCNIELLESHLRKHPNFKSACNRCGEVFPDYRTLVKHSAMHVTDNCAIRNNQLNLKILNYLENKNTIYQKLAENIEASQSYRCNFCNEHFAGSQFMMHWKQCKHFQFEDSNNASKLDDSMKSSKEDLADDEESDEMKSSFLAGLNLQSKSDKSSSDEGSPEKARTTTKLLDVISAFPKHSIFSTQDEPEKNSIDDDDDPFKVEVRDMKRRGEFPCRICKKIFRNLRALKGHARIHISGNRGIMPYECNICSFTTSDKSVVIRHIRNHNGDHPYKCQLCFSTFTTKANCERHLRNAHRKTSREDIKRLLVDLSSKPAVPNNVNNFKNKLQSLLTGALGGKKSDLTELLCKKIPDEYTQTFNEDDFYKKSIDKLENSMDGEKGCRIYEDGIANCKSDAEDSVNSNDSNTNPLLAKKFDNDYPPINPLLLNADYKYSTFHIPSGLDMRMSKSDKQFYDTNYKTYNDAIVGSAFVTNVIRDNGFIKAPFDSHYLHTDSDVDEPLDLSVDVLDLSKKKISSGGDDSGAEDLSVKTRQNSFSERSETLSPVRKAPVNALLNNLNQNMFFGKDELRYGFPNNQMITNFSTYFMQNPNVNLFPGNAKLDVEDEHAKIRPLIFGQLVANAAERYEEIRQNVSAFVDFNKKAESAQTEEAQHEGKVALSATDSNSKFNHAKDVSAKPRTNKSSTVKMVMKDGVLVEKQKQRRYRTEKPFSCAYCSGRFTLRSNMDRHVKQQHPGFWRQRQRGGSSRAQRTAKSTKEDTSEMPTLSSVNVAPSTPSEPDTLSRDVDLTSSVEKRSHSSVSDPDTEAEESATEKCKKKLKSGDGEVAVQPEDDDDDEEELVIDEEMEEHEQEEKSSSANEGGSAAAASNVLEKEGKVKEENPDLASVRSLLDNVSTQTFSQYFRNDEDPNKHEDGSEDDEEGLVAGSSSEGNGSGGEENSRVPNDLDSKSKNGKGEQTAKKKKSAYSSAPNRVHCDFCYRSFPWASSLRRHTLTHTGQKPYKCSNCPLLFTTKSNCDRHFLRKHRSQLHESAIANASAPQPSPATTATPASSTVNAAAITCNNSGGSDSERSSSTRLIPNFSTRNVPERPFKCSNCPSSTFSTHNNLKKHIIEKHNQHHQKELLLEKADDREIAAAAAATSPTADLRAKKDDSLNTSDNSDGTLSSSEKTSTNSEAESTNKTGGDQSYCNHVSSDLPFKCHLCDRSFGERQEALDHMGESHSVEFQHLICKGALDMSVKGDDQTSHDDAAVGCTNSDENAEQNRGRFPDYSSRKVICAFCLRRFWSAEDLRRHMRTHTGERPFACDICQRRFTLKHSMLRHRKKHSNKSSSFVSTSGENSPNSDDEEPASPGQASDTNADTLKNDRLRYDLPNDMTSKREITPMFSVAAVSTASSEKEAKPLDASASKSASGKQTTSCSKEDGIDLIAKLLDIDDKSLVDEMLTSKSADDVAKLLGVQK